MTDELILDHIKATGGNLGEMSEHLTSEELERAKQLMKRTQTESVERIVESLLNESHRWEFCGASGKLSHPDGFETSWFYWDDDSNSWRPQDVGASVPRQVADWVVSLEGTRDISTFEDQ